MTSEIVDIFDVQIDALEQFDVVVEQNEVNLEPLTITENGTYYPQGSATGFSKVEANVLPKSTDIAITENGEYYPNDYEVDAFSKVDVDVKPKLEEITATDNGTYTPSEGFDGFGKVNVDLRGKVKFLKITTTIGIISNTCVDENGRWLGDEFIDMSLCTDINFSGMTKLKYLNCSNWDTSSLVSLVYFIRGCSLIEYVDVSNFNTSKVNDIREAFRGCNALKMLDLKNWDMSKVTIAYNAYSVFYGCWGLETLIGDTTLEKVLENNIGCLNGLPVGTTLNQCPLLQRNSLRAIINGLAEVETTQTLTLGATLRAKLTEEDIAIATNKGWTIS